MLIKTGIFKIYKFYIQIANPKIQMLNHLLQAAYQIFKGSQYVKSFKN